jgi:predicted O-methyltransferase YrrM
VNDPIWNTVDEYFASALVPPDEALEAAQRAAADGGLPPISVSALQGQLLHLLARIAGATRILEIGTLGGYSTIWLARALPSAGHLISLEIDPHHAEVARANLDRAGVGAGVRIIVGRAADSLGVLAAEDPAPFDLVFIDADKASNAVYFEWALRLSHPGTVIVIDNVVRGGGVADASSQDADILGVRRLLEVMAADRRIEATAIQTVGVKGYDGFALAVVGAG